MSRKGVLIAALLLSVGGLTACNDDQQSCNDLAGNGNYSPMTEDGNVYCENAFNGDRFLLRSE